MSFLLVASAILFVTRSESSFPVAIKAFHYLDVPWFIVLTLLLAEKQFTPYKSLTDSNLGKLEMNLVEAMRCEDMTVVGR